MVSEQMYIIMVISYQHFVDSHVTIEVSAEITHVRLIRPTSFGSGTYYIHWSGGTVIRTSITTKK